MFLSFISAEEWSIQLSLSPLIMMNYWIVLSVNICLLLTHSAEGFLSLRIPQSQHVTTFTSTRLDGQPKLGHLENIPNPWDVFDGSTPETDCPGLPVGADVWPSPVTDPHDVELEATDTPGIPKGATLWPSPMREPHVPDTPSDCPGLPPRGSESIPPFIQEPRIP